MFTEAHGALRGSTFLVAMMVAAITWLAAPTTSRADLIFDFTFKGDSGAPGTVTGEIDLPDNANNNTTAALAVIVDSSTIGFPYPLPHNTIHDGVDTNSFTVANGVITSYDYAVEQIVGVRTLVYAIQFDAFGDILQIGATGIESGAPMTTFTSQGSTTVPEPASIAILGSGLVGLGLVRRRRNASRAAATIASQRA